MQIFTVGQVAGYLRAALEADEILTDLWIKGEISNLSRSAAGHLYFTLKDSAGQIRCAFFRPANHGASLADGMAVVAHGRVSFYEVSGQLQFYVDVVQPEGVGALHLEFERLKAKLEAEGLFDPSRKRPIPPFPRRIGMVTSPTGAVIHDIINIISRRYPLSELVLAPTPVQGDEAVHGITEALSLLNAAEGIDLIILARGGGSLEDLWAFNEERVARAIYASRAPVISGVGHETDVTIADLVADVRAPTPSAAAELAVPSRDYLASQVLQFQEAAADALANIMSSMANSFRYTQSRLLNLRPNLERERQRVDDLTRSALSHIRNLLTAQENLCNLLARGLEALNPQGTLGRGYALVHLKATGGLVTGRSQVGYGDPLVIQVKDGPFEARAEDPSLQPTTVPQGKPKQAKKLARQAHHNGQVSEQIPLFSG